MLSLFWTIDTGFELLGYFLMGLVTSTRLSLRWQINAHDLLKLVQSLCFGSSLAFYFHSILNRDLCMLLSSFFFVVEILSLHLLVVWMRHSCLKVGMMFGKVMELVGSGH